MHHDNALDHDPAAALDATLWWSAGTLRSVEATAVAASFAVLGTFGGATIASVVAQSVVGSPWSGADIRWDSVVSAGVALVFALGAILLGRRVIIAEGDEARWSGHLARAAVVVGGAGGVLSAIAVATGVLRGPPGS